MAEASKAYRVYREAVNEELPGDGGGGSGGGGGAHDPFFLNAAAQSLRRCRSIRRG